MHLRRRRLSRCPRMIFRCGDGNLAVSETAHAIAVGEPRGKLSHIALPDWLTAQRTERLRVGCPAIHQDEFHALPRLIERQSALSAGWRLFATLVQRALWATARGFGGDPIRKPSAGAFADMVYGLLYIIASHKATPKIEDKLSLNGAGEPCQGNEAVPPGCARQVVASAML
jgi:hypothetical protein